MDTHDAERRFLLGGLTGAAGIAALSGFAAAKGPLDPPSGPIGSSGFALGQLEPRTPIQSLPSGAGALHNITASGAYYLTGNLSIVNGQTAIAVNAPDVTIDLMGYTIGAPDGSTTATAVNAQSTQTRLEISGGRIVNTRLLLRGSGVLRLISFHQAGTTLVTTSTPGLWCVRDCTFAGVRGATPALQWSGIDKDLVVERCAFSAVGVGVDVQAGTRVNVDSCKFVDIGLVAVRVNGGLAIVTRNTAISCTGGFRLDAGTGVFLSNLAVDCQTPYSGVSGIATNVGSAGAWSNLQM